jgi:hypothetical protein
VGEALVLMPSLAQELKAIFSPFPVIPAPLRLTPRLLIWLLRSSPFYHKVAELSKHKNQRSLIHEQSSPYPQVSSRIQWASDDDRQMPRRKKDDSEKGQMIDGRVRKVT